MEKVAIKQNIQKLIEAAEDEMQLRSMLSCIQSIYEQPSHVWARLSKEAEEAVYSAYEESLSPDNIVSEPNLQELAKSWREASNGRML